MLFEKLRVILDATPRVAAVNMAFDEVLLTSITVPVLRIYRWLHPAISFGYFIRHSSVPDDGRECVRRMTGGGIVEHGMDLTYSLVIPRGHDLEVVPPRDSYRLIHEAIAEWLRVRGIGSVLAPEKKSETAQICFQSAAESDLVSAGLKIAGAAQRRTKAGLLHQGSVLCDRISEAAHRDFPSAFVTEWNAECADGQTMLAAEELASRKYALDSWTRRV